MTFVTPFGGCPQRQRRWPITPRLGLWRRLRGAQVSQSAKSRTLGLYGFGRIGRAVADYAEAFGMRVQWWSSDEGRERAAAAGVQVAASRAAFFAESDVVSLHVRLKPTTRGIITREDLDQMRPDALFVNTSRSGLVERGVLEDAVLAGRPGWAAVDVFDTEPLRDETHPLLNHPRVIATPHIGYVTEDEWDLQFTDIYEQVNAFAAHAPIHVINPDAMS